MEKDSSFQALKNICVFRKKREENKKGRERGKGARGGGGRREM